MEITRMHKDGKYVGSITKMNNGDKIYRDSHGSRTGTYNASTGQVRDSKGHLIKKVK